MNLICVCDNCKATINYNESDIDNKINYIQADPIQKGKLITWERNVFKKIKIYFINCPQCKKDTVCGREILEDRIYLENI